MVLGRLFASNSRKQIAGHKAILKQVEVNGFTITKAKKLALFPKLLHLVLVALLFTNVSLKAQVPGTGIYCYNEHVKPDDRAVINALRKMPTQLSYGPDELNFRLARNPFFAKLGVSYIIVSRQKNTAEVLFLADSLALRKFFLLQGEATDSYPSTLLALHRDTKQHKWIANSTHGFFGNTFEIDQHPKAYKFRFWQTDAVTDCFSLQFVDLKFMHKANQTDTLNYLTANVSTTKLHYNATLHYDEFKRHTDNFRISYVDIIPNLALKAIPVYETANKTAKVIGYWHTEKYACVKKRFKNGWISADFYATTVVNEKGILGDRKEIKLNTLKGYVKL